MKKIVVKDTAQYILDDDGRIWFKRKIVDSKFELISTPKGQVVDFDVSNAGQIFVILRGGDDGDILQSGQNLSGRLIWHEIDLPDDLK